MSLLKTGQNKLQIITIKQQIVFSGRKMVQPFSFYRLNEQLYAVQKGLRCQNLSQIIYKILRSQNVFQTQFIAIYLAFYESGTVKEKQCTYQGAYESSHGRASCGAASESGVSLRPPSPARPLLSPGR